MRLPVESLRKGLSVLECLCGSAAPLALSDVAARMGWKRTTTYNLIKTLSLCGYAENVGDGRYGPGWRVGDLGRSLWRRGGMAGIATVRPVVRDIASDLDESVVLAVLIDGRRHVIARAEGNQLIRVSTDVLDLDDRSIWSVVTGRVLAACASAGERSHIVDQEGVPSAGWPSVSSRSELFAALDRIRDAGLAENEEQDVCSMAVPVVLDGRGVVAAVGTYLPSFRYDGVRREVLLSGLRHGASRLAPILADALGGPSVDCAS